MTKLLRSKLKSRSKPRANLGYLIGKDGRIIGHAHQYLAKHLVDWIKLLGGPKAVAGQIRRTKVGKVKTTKRGHGSRNLDPSMISKLMHAQAMFPLEAIGTWADDLCLNDGERDALLNVAVIANASKRLLVLFNWKRAVRERGAALVKATKARLKQKR